MPNTPNGTVDNISIGNAVVYIGDEGVTPTDDVGYLTDDGITITYETETVDVTAGFPKTSIRQFVTAVTVSFTFTSLEWNLALFERALVGNLTTTATEEVLDVGVDACPTELTGQVQFCMPCVGDTIIINLWRIQSDGNFEINFDGNNPHSFAYNFRSLLAQQKWNGDPLDADEGLFEIIRQLAP